MPDDGEYGMYVSGNKSTGTVRDVELGICDGIAGPTRSEQGLYDNFHLLPPFGFASVKLLTGMKQPYTNQPGSFTNAFDEYTWLLLLVSLIVLTATTVLHIRFSRQRKVTLQDISNTLVVLLQTIFQEATKKRFRDTFWYLQGGGLILGTFFLMQLYQCNNKANLVIESPTYRLDTVEQLLKEKKSMIIYYPKSTPVETDLKLLTGEIGALMRERLEKDDSGSVIPVHIFAPNVRQALLDRKGVIMIDETSMDVVLKSWCMANVGFFYKNRGANIFPVYSVTAVFSRRLPFEFLDKLDQSVHWLNAYGVVFEPKAMKYRGHHGCITGNTKRQSETTRAINLSGFASGFAALAIGLALGFFTLLFELYIAPKRAKV